ncbi:MAG: TrmO family methyltransferase domain-containing protein [Phycisphaerae bacterium]
MVQCVDCGREVGRDEAHIIDGETVCLRCLHGDAEPVVIYPIGVVHNDKTRRPDGFGTSGGDVSEIRLYCGQKRFLKGLADESKLTVVWQLHRRQDIRSEFHRGWDGKHVGVFASRTPDRVTPIAVTDVDLLEVRDDTLVVRGLDAIDGTPVLDIKVAPASLRQTPR